LNFSLPDFFGAILKQYIENNIDKNPRYYNFFEKLRSKYAYIINLDTNKKWTRNKPFDIKDKNTYLKKD